MSDCSCDTPGFNTGGAGGQGLVVSGTPQVGYVVGWDGTKALWEAVPTGYAITAFSITTGLVLLGQPRQ